MLEMLKVERPTKQEAPTPLAPGDGSRAPMPEAAELMLREYLGSRRLAPATRQLYGQALQSWVRRIPTPLGEADAEAVAMWYAEMSGEGYGPATILMYAVKLRAIYAWTLRRQGIKKRAAATLAGDLFDEVPLGDLRRQAAQVNELRDKLVTTDEYDALMAATDHPRLRAVLAALYESQARPGELLGLRLRDLDFRERYAQIRVSGKTGERTIPLIRAIPYLRAWLQVHPSRDDPDAPLFVRIYRGELGPITVDGLQSAFRRLRRRAGLERRIHPYMFRHTRLTELADRGIGEFQLKVLAGWTASSRQAATYVHLSGRSGVAPILEMEGVEVPAEAQLKPSPIRLRTCPRCEVENEGDALYCMRCGLALDDRALHVEEERVATTEDVMDALMRSPKVKAVLAEAMRELVARGGADG